MDSAFETDVQKIANPTRISPLFIISTTKDGFPQASLDIHDVHHSMCCFMWVTRQ
jgi:hypothetical protein